MRDGRPSAARRRARRWWTTGRWLRLLQLGLQGQAPAQDGLACDRGRLAEWVASWEASSRVPSDCLRHSARGLPTNAQPRRPVPRLGLGEAAWSVFVRGVGGGKMHAPKARPPPPDAGWLAATAPLAELWRQSADGTTQHLQASIGMMGQEGAGIGRLACLVGVGADRTGETAQVDGG